MDDNNFNGANYKDFQFEDQIDQALNEYNLIARKINESKNDLKTNRNNNI